MTNVCQYLSMYFLASKVLVWVIAIYFKMKSPKAACILFQVLAAIIVIEFFPCKFIRNEGFNIFPVEEVAEL